MMAFIRNVFSKKSRYLVIFVPFRSNSDHIDPVAALAEPISRLCGRFPRCVVIEEKPTHFSDVSRLTGVRRLPRYIILFAHPSTFLPGFATRRANGEEDALTIPWWQTSNHRFEMMVAHVCRGKSILNKRDWRPVFPKWVSYTADIRAFLPTSRDRKIWARIGKAIIDAAVSTRSPGALKDRICAAYLEAMAQLKESYKLPGTERNIIHILHVQKALDGVMSNEDL